MPKRKYIGGEGYRLRAAQMIPGFIDRIRERADAYGVDPNLVLHRILKEGWIDQNVQNYNALPAEEQDAYWGSLWDQPVAGYGSFGLDYAGDNLMKGRYTLKDPEATWYEAEFDDEEGGQQFRKGTSLMASNLPSAIEILAADLAYRKGQVANLYGYEGDDLNTWTNASFNMGLHHKDLKNEDYIRRKYSGYPDYYGQMATQKKLGGIIEKYGRERLENAFAKGGKIYIKPENRGKFTALKKRTGHSASWFKAHGTPAQKKMAVFALNSKKWKHEDGGFLNRVYAKGGLLERAGSKEKLLELVKKIKQTKQS